MTTRDEQVLRLAGDFAATVFMWTARLPEDERYMMVPMLRDAALSMLENASLGLARYSPTDRYRLLSRAQTSLEELHSRLSLCKVIGLLLPKDEAAFQDKYSALRNHLHAIADSLYRSIRDLPPS